MKSSSQGAEHSAPTERRIEAQSQAGKVCPRCWAKYRGTRPAYFGDDPKCAFPDGARFTHGNWQCATLDVIRDLVGEYPCAVERDGINVLANWDQKIATVIIHDGIDLDYEEFPVALVVSWYKRRGGTDTALLIFDDGSALPPTASDIEAICAGYAQSSQTPAPQGDRAEGEGSASLPRDEPQ